nr:unnamed protein product [Spirometra erinaceieuropaei]
MADREDHVDGDAMAMEAALAFRQESSLQKVVQKIEKDASEGLPGDVQHGDVLVVVTELVVPLLLLEMVDCGFLEILRNLSLAPHLLEERCQVIHKLEACVLETSAEIASDRGALSLDSCSTVLMASWRIGGRSGSTLVST